MKRIMLLLLLGCLMFSCWNMPLAAATSGTCGENLTWILEDDGVLTVSGTGAMQGSSWNAAKVRTVILEEGVTTVGNSAFYNCRYLTSVHLPASVTSIGEWAFSYCISLEDITIPHGVQTIGNHGFYGCTGLTDVVFPDSVITIDYEAFSGCINLTNVTIPDSVTSIWFSTFHDCNRMSITGYSGSYAEQFARKNQTPFMAYPMLEQAGITVSGLWEDLENALFCVEIVKAPIDVQLPEFPGKDMQLYQLNLQKNGYEFQPVHAVQLKIPVPDDMGVGTCNLYYVSENGSMNRVETRYQDGFLVFHTDQLGQFALLGEWLPDINLPGDLNADSILSVTDVVLLRKAILEGQMTSEVSAGDMNGDSCLSVTDVVLLRKAILNQISFSSSF